MSALVILSTANHALTSTPYTFTPDSGIEDSNVQSPPQSWRVRCFGDVPFNLAVNTGDATASDMPVAAEFPGVVVVVPAGGSLSVVKRGSGPDGQAWFNRIKHS